jgi:hypothetical protein
VSVGAAVALGAVVGLALGVLVSVTTDLPLAPEIGAVLWGPHWLALKPGSCVSEQTAAGIVLIPVPILFNVGFSLLAQRFDYPDILRRPTHEALERFRAGGAGRSSLLSSALRETG